MCGGKKINVLRANRAVLFLAAIAACGFGGPRLCSCGNNEPFPLVCSFGQAGSSQSVSASPTSPAASIQEANVVFAPLAFIGAPLSITGSSRTHAPTGTYGGSPIELSAQLPPAAGYLASTTPHSVHPLRAEQNYVLRQSSAQLCVLNRSFNSYSFELESAEFCD